MESALKKELEKKKILHPNSRKSIALIKKSKKMANRQKAKMSGMMKQSLIGEKMLWIQEHMVPDVCPYTPELTAELLERYIARNDEELEQIAIKHSISNKRIKQHASREDILRMTKERDLEEYNTCGIEIPDILNASQCNMLRKWNRELRFLPNFKFRRFGRKHAMEALQKASKLSVKKSNVPNKYEDTKSLQERITQNTQNSSSEQTTENVTKETNEHSECSMDTE